MTRRAKKPPVNPKAVREKLSLATRRPPSPPVPDIGEPSSAFRDSLIRYDRDLIELDNDIANLQRALKDLKKQRDDVVAKLRGTIRDAARPLFQTAGLPLDARTETASMSPSTTPPNAPEAVL